MAATPISKSSANFQTTQLLQGEGYSLSIGPTWKARLFYSLITLGGLLPFILVKVIWGQNRKSDDALLIQIFASLIFGFVGVIFIFIGLLLSLFGHRERPWFDLRRRCFWKDKYRPQEGTPDNWKEYTPFSEIVGLQILTRRCGGTRNKYLNYELNLVRRDGSRCNLESHANKEAIEQDAATLAKELKVPIPKIEINPKAEKLI